MDFFQGGRDEGILSNLFDHQESFLIMPNNPHLYDSRNVNTSLAATVLKSEPAIPQTRLDIQQYSFLKGEEESLICFCLQIRSALCNGQSKQLILV